MGQAKRKKDLGVITRRARFIELMKMISGYSEDRIEVFADNRGIRLKGLHNTRRTG